MAEDIKYSAIDIYNILRHEIFDLTIKPGEQVNEADLCERFNISRTPVREVMKRLASVGLLTVVPYKGSYATLLNLNEIKQYVYMRNVLESAVLAEFTEIVSLAEIETIRYELQLQKVMLKEHLEKKESDADFVERFYRADSIFHKIWFTACNKKLIWETIKRSQVQYRRYRTLDMMSMTKFESIVDEHEKMLALIENKQKNELKEVLENHLYGGIHRLENPVTQKFRNYFVL